MLVGIDLGTTNSAVAVWRDGKAELIPNSLGDYLTPSAVSINDAGEILVGLAARERQSTHPAHTATAFKRLMGTNERRILGKKQFVPEELSALVLGALKADAEAYLGEPVTGAIITVPAYFNDRQRKATRTAGRLAGLNVERLVNEPTAAALAHGIHELNDAAPFLVFDLGGGTFDVSLVEIFDGIIEVRASAGDNRLGGEDFNEAVATLGCQRIDNWGAIREAIAAKDKNMFREVTRSAAERTRRALTEAPEAEFSFVWQEQAHTTRITEAQFETEAASLIARLRDPVLRSLRDSNVQSAELGKIIMVGGATRMPIVRRAVTKMFGRFPDYSLDPDHAVALGAAVQAGLKSRDAALDEVRLTDVCPFTLGIETSSREAGGQIVSGLFTPIIERNTVIPASREYPFSPISAQQRIVDIPIYQGESRHVANNILLGKVELPLPPNHRGEVMFLVRFTYDVSGLLDVDVKIPETGLTRQLTICDTEDRMSEADIAARRKALEKLKIHPRDQDANAATLARANKCYEDRIGQEREYLASLIDQFNAVLAKQNPRDIEAARKELERLLDEIDGAQFL